MDGRANPVMDWQAAVIFVVVAVVTSPTTADVVVCEPAHVFYMGTSTPASCNGVAMARNAIFKLLFSAWELSCLQQLLQGQPSATLCCWCQKGGGRATWHRQHIWHRPHTWHRLHYVALQATLVCVSAFLFEVCKLTSTLTCTKVVVFLHHDLSGGILASNLRWTAWWSGLLVAVVTLHLGAGTANVADAAIV